MSAPVGLTDLHGDDFYFNGNFYDFDFEDFDLKQVSLSSWKPTGIGEIWQPGPDVI